MNFDFSSCHNPYDFGNPVLEEDLFAGRKKELEEIDYYLDHAKTAPKAINLALVGQRASGKTSFLNITESKAKERDFITVRIDLDEGDVSNQSSFFFKLFDSILTSVCKNNFFSGINGKTYETYLDMISLYEIPEDKTFSPFIFPIQYAKAMSKNNLSINFSDTIFKEDLKKIKSQCSKTIVILFDECDVLSINKICIQKLRNIFMNLSGYMLVFSGTPSLFPLMNEVFSPIARQFNKINIDRFESFLDTRDCIYKPLEKLKIPFDSVINQPDIKLIIDIHDLSNGRPYEIQLLCHAMFKKVQKNLTKKMSLNLGILEEVLKQLESSEDISNRQIIIKSKILSKKQLIMLDKLCSCSNASLDDIFNIEYIFSDISETEKQEISSSFKFFIDNDILNYENNIIKFNGDYFDKMYIKYFASEQNINIRILELPMSLLIHIKIANLIDSSMLAQLSLYHKNTLDSIISLISNENNSDIFLDDNKLFFEVYEYLLNNRNKKSISFIEISVEINPNEIINFYLFIKDNELINEYLESLFKDMEFIIERAKKLNKYLSCCIKKIEDFSIESIVDKVTRSENEKSKSDFVDLHMRKLYSSYVEDKDLDEAIFNANLLDENNFEMTTANSYNNIGYLYLITDNIKKSRKFLDKSISLANDNISLYLYNYAILEIKSNNLESAISYFNKCIDSISSDDIKIDCVITFYFDNKNILYEEITGDISIEDLCLTSIKVIEEYLELTNIH